jgi:nucleoid-associated protein YgaU
LVLRGIVRALCLVTLPTIAVLVPIPRGDRPDVSLPNISAGPVAARIRTGPTVAPPTPQAPSFDVVSVASDGTAVIAGRAAPGSLVQVFDGSKQLGEVVADKRGEWVLIPDRPLAAGARRLSLRAATKDGPMVAAAKAVTVTVAHATPAGVASPPAGPSPAKPSYVVLRGNSLWQIARRLLGSGLRYLAIYTANRGQIRKPDLIYPGQVLKLPQS